MTQSKVIEISEVSSAMGVSRKTAIRAALKNNALVHIGNKYFVDTSKIGKLCDHATTCVALKKKARIYSGWITLQEAANEVGASRTTMLRIASEANDLTKCVNSEGRWFVNPNKLSYFKKRVLPQGNPVTHNYKAMQKHSRKMLTYRWNWDKKE